jgi:uncharacterized protein
MDLKIVFTGTPGAGKTTAIAALSDVAPMSTEATNTDVGLDKATTTVGLDYGHVDLGDGVRVRLFGTPGQARFDFMWRIVAAQALGLVILVDNSRPAPLNDLAVYLDHFSELLPSMNCVVGVGRNHEHPAPTLDDFADALAERELAFPVLAVDVRQRDDVLQLVEAVIAQAEANESLGKPA